MRKIESLNEISDGNLYDINSMVKTDAAGCKGCFACCVDVADLVELSPFDLYLMKEETNKGYDELLEGNIHLVEVGKINLPYLDMDKVTKRCSFLGKDDRCSIHSARPNICRLFPLGRVYQNDDFKYFLQEGACLKPKLNKIKVKRWIQVSDYRDNKDFIIAWYQFIKALQFKLKFVKDDERKTINHQLIQQFYIEKPTEEENFYNWFNNQLAKAKQDFGII